MHVTIQRWPKSKPVALVERQRKVGVELASTVGENGQSVVVVASVDTSGTAADSGIQKGDISSRFSTPRYQTPIRPRACSGRDHLRVTISRLSSWSGTRNSCGYRSPFQTEQAFGEWGSVFGDHVVATAILDWLLHRSLVLTIRGDS